MPNLTGIYNPKQKKTSDGVEKTDKLDDSWKAWKAEPSPVTMATLMQHADPIIGKAMTSYAPNSSPAVRSKAKILARSAFDSYDPAKGAKLQTHLHIQLQPLRREAMSYETLHVPENVRFDIRDMHAAHNNFVTENGREPSDRELADYTGISTKRVAHIRRFDKSIVGEGQFTKHDDDENDTTLPESSRGTKLWADAVYEEMGDQDKLIYDLKTGRNGRTSPTAVIDIARKLKMTPSAISQKLSKIDARMAEGEDYDA
jgi:DNA-directed RNA polymerase specialized sigma subunit